jgi:hypothetical protein
MAIALAGRDVADDAAFARDPLTHGQAPDVRQPCATQEPLPLHS